MKKILSFAFLCLFAISAYAQNDALITNSIKKLAYIESKGGYRENAFTTDYAPNTATVVKLGFQQTGNDGWMGIFCARNQRAGTGISLYVNGNTNANLGYFTGATAGAGDGFVEGYQNRARYDVVAHTSYLKWSVDGGEWKEKATGNTEMVATDRKLSFFANPEWDQQFVGRIFYASVEEGDEVKAEWLPAMKSDGTWGLYNTVSEKWVAPAKGDYTNYLYGVLDGKTYIPADLQKRITVQVGKTVTIDPQVIGPMPENITYRGGGTYFSVEGNTITGLKEGSGNVQLQATDADGVAWKLFINVEVVDASLTSYTPVEYIEHKGGRRENAMISDYIPNSNTTVSLGFQQTGNNGWGAMFCARNTYAGTGMSLYVNGTDDGGNKYLGYFTGDARGENDRFLDYENGARYDVKAHTTKLEYSIDGGDWQAKETGKTEMNATSRKMSLFANPEWDNSWIGKIYYLNIDDEEVHYAYLPAMRHDGAIGFWDEASGKFFTAAEGNMGDYTFGKKEGETYVELSATSLTLKKGDVETLTATGIEGGTWTTNKASVATVENGVITATGIGTAVISYVVDSWKVTATVEVIPNTVEVSTAAIENWDGEKAEILGSIRHSGDQYRAAYTWEVDSYMGYKGEYFNHVFGVPSADENGNEWYAAEYEMTNDAVDTWTYNNTVLPSGWPENMGDVYVRRYFKTVEGAQLPETVYMPAAHDDAPCEYYINGVLVWARTGDEPGVNGWYEDEVVRLTAEQKALIKTDGSVNVFAYHVHQNWGGRYADGGLYTDSDNKVANLFRGNDDRKRLENALAQAETVEGIDADVLNYARNANVCLQDAGHALNMVRWELRKALSPRYEYNYASATPADDMEVYIYNVGAGQFLAGSNRWGTHASLDANPNSWPMILHGNGTDFAIQTNLPNGTRGKNDWLNYGCFVDTEDHDNWRFEEVGDGSYRIINLHNSGENIYLGMTEDDRYQVDSDKVGADNPYNHWKLITPAQFEALYATATPENPANISYKIHQNSFSQNDFDGNEKGAANADMNDSPWVRNAGSVWNWKAEWPGDLCYEMWNARNEEDGEVYIKQTVTGLKPGKYIVGCDGYYRDGSWESSVAGNREQLAYLYAGTRDNKVALKSQLDGANKGAGYGNIHDTYYVVDGLSDVTKFFHLGSYRNEIEVTVGEDGILEFGVFRANEGAKERDHIVLDNFTLTALEVESAVPAKMYVRYNNTWGGREMEVVASEVPGEKHYRYEGWTSTNRDEGIFINFKDDKGNFWCPQEINFEDEWVKLHTIDCGVATTDLANTGNQEYAGFAVTAPTNMIAVDLYMTAEGARVEFTNTAAQHAGEHVYLAGENFDGWSRNNPGAERTLNKVEGEEGVYEGVVTVNRPNEYFDMVRLFTKPNNGDNDDYIGFNNNGRQTTYAADGTYQLSYRPAGDFRMRKGDTKIRVDLNTGEVTFKYLGEKSYVYAVGNVVNVGWNCTNKDVKLYETKAGSLIYQGVVEMEGNGELTFYEERTSTGWDEGRFGPREGGNKQQAAGVGEWYDGLGRWGDRGWKGIPAGKWLMTLDVANDRFMYEPLPSMLYSAPAVFQSDEFEPEEILWPETHNTVEVWSDNSVMLRGWAGAEGYDLQVKFEGKGNMFEDEDGVVSFYGGGAVTDVKAFDADGEEIALEMQIVEVDEAGEPAMAFAAVPTGREDSPVAAFVFFDFGEGLAPSGYGSIMDMSGSLFVMVVDPENPDAYVYSIEWSPEITTGVTSVATIKRVGTWNIAGQKVNDAFKGIVIKDGKKFLKK